MIAEGIARRLRHAPKTLGALALLTVPLPVTLAVTAAALVRSLLVPSTRAVAEDPRTVLVSGGKSIGKLVEPTGD